MQVLDHPAIVQAVIVLEQGEALLELLPVLAADRGWAQGLVRGAGRFALIELAREAGEITMAEDAAILSLTGSLGGPIHAVVLAGGQVHSGRVVASIAEEVLLEITAVAPEIAADAPLHRPPAQPPPPAPPSEPPPPEPPAKPPPSEPPPVELPADPPPVDRLAEPPPLVLEPAAPKPTGQAPSSPSVPGPVRHDTSPPLSAPKPPSQSFRRPIARKLHRRREHDPIPEAGDYLSHPQLGLCRVEGDDGSDGTIITSPSGRRRVLKLDALRVQPAETDDEGRRVFQIMGPRR